MRSLEELGYLNAMHKSSFKPTTNKKTEHGKGDSKSIILIHKAPFHHTRTFILRIIGHVPAGRKQEILDDFLTGFSCYTYTLAQTSLTFAGDGDSN